MTRALAVAASLLCTAIVTGQAPTFRSNVDLVRVDALVMEGRAPVTGLTDADFEIRDNGVLQTIDRVAYENVPLTVIFAVDTSGSVQGAKLRNLQRAVSAAVEGLHPGDRSALLTFSHQVQIRAALTDSRQIIRSAMSAVIPIGGTALNDATYAALAMSDTGNARVLVLVFSDGLDNSSWLSVKDVQRAARRSDAVVYSVVVGGRTERGLNASGKSVYTQAQTNFLEGLASTTGGRLLKADGIDNLPQTFAAILREFRTRYLITYYPRRVETRGWHAVDVRLKKRRGQVTARRGYQR
jgi:Ca-activated chloride channel family protein